ncbi:MAG TPA: glycosyltransferase [Actinomycetota bacterium]|jgi:glycosyltransferase involved in cell wall biosynthesis
MSATRVTRIITRLNVGGPARQAVSLTRRLGDRGYDCALLTGREGPREGRIEPGHATTVVPSLRRDVHPLADLRAGRELARLVRAHRPDVVHTHLAKAGALGRLAAHRAGTQVVVHTYHGHVLEGYFSRPVSRAFLEVERRLAAWSTALVAVSDAVRAELLALGIGRPHQWRVIPVGLELDPLLGPLPRAAAARETLGLPVVGPVVGIVGRLVPVKDHETFLAAAARIVRERPSAHVAIVGDGELRERLGPRAAALLGRHVTFTGWVEDLPALYAALDVVVLTSRNEGTPVALIEAGAAGKPVVATRVGGVAEVVEDGRTGALVGAGDAEGVAGEVLRLLDDPGLARARGEAARAHVRTRFSAARLEEDVDFLYRELLERSIRSGTTRSRRFP